MASSNPGSFKQAGRSSEEWDDESVAESADFMRAAEPLELTFSSEYERRWFAQPTVMELLGKHMEHEGLQESGVGLFGNLACNDENRAELIRLGSIGHVLRCWNIHVASVGL